MKRDTPAKLYFLLSLALVFAGCGGELGRDELGKVIFTLPKLPGSERPYPLPPLESAVGEGTPAKNGDVSTPDARKHH